MNKVLYISAGILLLIFAFAILGIALTASMASLANGAANLALSMIYVCAYCPRTSTLLNMRNEFAHSQTRRLLHDISKYTFHLQDRR